MFPADRRSGNSPRTGGWEPATSRRWTKRRSSGAEADPEYLELGLMGIEVPGAVWWRRRRASHGRCWPSKSWREWMRSAAHPYYVDVHQYAGEQRFLLRLGNRRASSARYFPRLNHRPARRVSRSPEAGGAGSDGLRAGHRRAERVGGWLGADRPESSGSPTGAEGRPLFIVFATRRSAKGYKGITRVHRGRRVFPPDSPSGKKENKLGIRASAPTEADSSGSAQVRRANVLGPIGQGLQDRDRDPQTRCRIGIGAAR